MLRLVAVIAAAVMVTSALPSSLLTDAHAARTQAKRAQEVIMFGNQQNRPSDASSFYQSIKKRAAPVDVEVSSTIATSDTTKASITDVDGSSPERHELLDELRKQASVDGNGKTVSQYEKGYQYGVGKDALQKQAENSLLKSDIYGDPATNVNEYRYYGGGDSRLEEQGLPSPIKRSVSYLDAGTRLKRDLELDPESLMALIALWQSQRNNYNPRDRASEWSSPPRYGYERLEENEVNGGGSEDTDDEENTNGEWYENPVTPGRYQYEAPAFHLYNPVYHPSMKRAYYQRIEKKRPQLGGQWGGFTQDKRFMVSKKRQYDRWDDPMLTRLLATQPRESGLMMPQRRIVL